MVEPTNNFFDSSSVVINFTKNESTLQKKHNSMAYHKVRESIAIISILCVYATTSHDDHLCLLSLFQELDVDTIAFYIIAPSNEMFNIMERSHGYKVMEYSGVGTNHFNIVYLCDNVT